MPTLSHKFSMSRKEAADILDVSTRTLDRYIRDKKLNSRKRKGNIYLNEEEVQNFQVSRFQNQHGASPDVPGRAHRHVNNTTVSAETTIDAETGAIEESTPEVGNEELVKATAREAVFEELYHLSRRENREVANKLDSANYRLGQLETQLKHSVPLLEYREQTENLRDKEKSTEVKMKRQEETIEILDQEIRAERLNKNIYIGLLFGLLALQPLLWLLLQS